MVDVLIVEDNDELANLLCDFLKKENYIVSIANDGERALELFEMYGAKLVILDIVLPSLDGFSILSKIRENSNTPVIIVSAKTEKDDKLNGLILGADDYIEKPYDIDILLAKVKGIFKRKYAMDEINEENIKLDLINNIGYVDEKNINLSAKEFELLKMLITNKGVTLKKDYLFNQIWGSDSDSELQTLTVHITNLKSKLGKNNANKIQTVWGVGYKFL